MIKMISNKAKFRCSNGILVTQGFINGKYHKAKKKKYDGCQSVLVCQGCEECPGNDNDHTIAQARCKVIGKTELIWDIKNFVWSCRKCHQHWENFKSGEWCSHKNVLQRLVILRKHDPEGYNVRVNLTPAESINSIQLLEI